MLNYKHNKLIIICLYDACGRSNERPYRLSAVKMSDDCVVGVYKSIGPGTASLLRPTIYSHPKCRDVPWCVRKRGAPSRCPVSKGTRAVGVFHPIAIDPYAGVLSALTRRSTSVVVAAPCAGLAPTFAPTPHPTIIQPSRDARSSVRKRRTSE